MPNFAVSTSASQPAGAHPQMSEIPFVASCADSTLASRLVGVSQQGILEASRPSHCAPTASPGSDTPVKKKSDLSPDLRIARSLSTIKEIKEWAHELRYGGLGLKNAKAKNALLELQLLRAKVDTATAGMKAYPGGMSHQKNADIACVDQFLKQHIPEFEKKVARIINRKQALSVARHQTAADAAFADGHGPLASPRLNKLVLSVPSTAHLSVWRQSGANAQSDTDAF